METITPHFIQKELIPHFHFADHEVLIMEDEKKKRKELLYRAMILGNAYHAKVKITFETTDGVKQVETTVWATTEGNIILKGGIVVPIHAIWEVKS